jgi:hypothetical protein
MAVLQTEKLREEECRVEGQYLHIDIIVENIDCLFDIIVTCLSFTIPF